MVLSERQHVGRIMEWRGAAVEVSHVLAELEIQKYAGSTKLDVVAALLHDMVLGEDWLFDADAVIYHKEHLVKVRERARKR